MAPKLPQHELNRIEERLKYFRDHPPNTQDVSEADLAAFFNFLVPQDAPAATDEPLHWFCAKAEPVVVEAAIFLIRLHAYSGPRVKMWRTRLETCLAGCTECVKEMQEAKHTSRYTYFGAFQDGTLRAFYKSFTEQDILFIVKTCKNAQLLPNAPSHTSKTLSDVPPSVVYLMLSDLQCIRDARIMGLLRSHLPRAPIDTWPTDLPPAGLFLLLVEQSLEVRSWASLQMTICTRRPIQPEHFTPTYVDALRIASTLITDPTAAEGALSFTDDTLALWQGYSSLLRFVPAERLRSSQPSNVDIRQLVVGHLSDTGKHFQEVLKAFLVTLARLGSNMWKDEGDEYPLVVFNTIKDNTSFSELLRSLPSDQVRWAIQWIEAYVKSIADLPALANILPLMLQYLCEALQHERFQDARPIAVMVASKLIHSVLFEQGSQTDSGAGILALVGESLDIHAKIFVSVAFGKVYDNPLWKEARAEARKLIKASLKSDVTNIHKAVLVLAGPLKQETIIPTLRIRVQIWQKTYQSITHDDAYGIATILEVLATIAHVDNLRESVFSFSKLKDPAEGLKALRAVNTSLHTVREGLSDAVSRYLDFSDSTSVLNLLGERDMALHVMFMMFSPLESTREPVQAIAGLAMDVESRPDCFRALILNFPRAAFDGMTRFLETFIKFAPRMPEACSLSKALALCLTDVIDVLCSNPDGLLHKGSFLRSIGEPGPEVLLPKWWSLMCSALTIIFKETPKWAPFFENSEMVVWMRDALIFGRDMLAQRKVIETGALALSFQTSANRKSSHIGSKMVDQLQDVLLELTRWLRLTDEELLFQAFALLQSLLGCFKETSIDPSEAALAKLKKQVDNAQSKDPQKSQTRLDTARINGLRDTLRSFEESESDDEVQIIEHIIPAARTEPKKKQKEVEQKARNLIQQKLKPVTAKSKQPERKDTTNKSKVPSIKEMRAKLEEGTSLPRFSRPSASSSRSTSTVSRPQAEKVVPAPQSSSDSESSGDEGEGGLEALAKMQKAPVVKKPVERRQVKLLDVPTNGRNPAIDRLKRSGMDEARRTTLRLKPDISSLHRTILSWNYDHSGPHPPGQDFRLARVPDKFENVRHYRDIFEPLLLMECWAQLQQSKEADEAQYDCLIVGRQYSDSWADLDISITEGVHKDWSLADTDIVLLSYPANGKTQLCKVQSFKHTPTGFQATLRMLLNIGEPGPQATSTWRLKKVFSLTTLHREYGALMAMPYYDSCNMILVPRLEKSLDVGMGEVQSTMKAYNVNEPQAKAILNALRTEGFSLIQGPPGTGKTSTICGLVQSFLSKRAKPATFISVGRTSGPADKEMTKKILLCAPSNAAIDEITYRLKEGVSGPGRQIISPKVVRVGNPKSMNVSVKDVSLDYLTEQKVNSNPGNKPSGKESGSDMALLRSELESVKRIRQEKLDEMLNIRDNTAKTLALEEEVKKLNKHRTYLTHQLDKLRDQQKSDSRAMDALSRRFRAEVLQDADVICSTLAGSGHEMLEAYDFEMVIIDEAAQAIELSSLIPLKYRSSRCIMVGDPQQLPPTVISQEASKFGYNQSLFVRLQKHRPDAVHLLSIQYRMHPEISLLPSRVFYQGRLLDGPDMASKTAKPWHTNPKFGPYRFYNVAKGVEEMGRFHSLLNRTESHIAVALYNRLRQEYSSFDFDFKVGVVSMYRAQISELRRAFEQRFGIDVARTIDFNTVDGFQGQEKDVIILSCVRAGPGVTNVGFLADVRRMNVALTRAKSSVFVLGNAPTLERSDETWKAIVQDARERTCLVDVDVSFFTAPSTAKASVPVARKVSGKTAAAKPPTPVKSEPPIDLIPLNRRASGSTSKTISVTPADQRDRAPEQTFPQPKSTSTLKAEPEAPRVGQKRPADEPLPVRPPPAVRVQQQPGQHDNDKSMGAPPQQNQPPKPKKPLMKRPKPPPSLFIPSKRPAPPDGGPSTNRRRT